MRGSFTKLGCGVVAALVFSAAQASAVILSWDVTGHGSPVDATLVASTVGSNLDTSGGFDTLSRVGVNGAAAGSSFNSSAWNATSTFNQTTKYITFTIKPADGYELTLTDLRAAMNGSNTAPNNGRWGYSLDGGTTFTFQSDFTMANAAPSSLNRVFDFPDFTTTNAVVFRFWEWGAVSINGGVANGSAGTTRIANIGGDDLVLNGTTSLVIPEPSVIGLIGLGIVGLLAFARRRYA